MYRMILAAAALALAAALAGCSTTGSTTTFASANNFLSDSSAVLNDNGDIGHVYRVYPGDETIPALDPNGG